MLRFYISIQNNLITGVVIKKLLWSQNRAHFVEFGVNRLTDIPHQNTRNTSLPL